LSTSDRQMRTIAEDVLKLAKERSYSLMGVSGLDDPHWVLVDLVDVVVHIFAPETRRFYDLDLLWGDAPKVRWQRRKAPPADPE